MRRARKRLDWIEEPDMSATADVNESSPLPRRLARWGRNLRDRRVEVGERNCCGVDEAANAACESGATCADLRTLAGKWPDAARPLTQRLEQLKLDATAIRETKPQVIRDLQKVCSLCVSQHKCQHDLTTNPSDPAWQAYCPNATTLTTLANERADREPS